MAHRGGKTLFAALIGMLTASLGLAQSHSAIAPNRFDFNLRLVRDEALIVAKQGLTLVSHDC